jgi:hypothetical protein
MGGATVINPGTLVLTRNVTLLWATIVNEDDHHVMSEPGDRRQPIDQPTIVIANIKGHERPYAELILSRTARIIYVLTPTAMGWGFEDWMVETP